MTRAFIGMGSNLQQPLQQLRQAYQALQQLPDTHLCAASSIYRSSALTLDDEPQDDYLNAVIEIDTQLHPETLLDALQTIENTQGRKREKRWGARTLDLDILLYGDECCHTPRLTLPHGEMTKRRFVLQPLQQIAPMLALPDGRSIDQLLAVCEGDALIHVSEFDE